MRENEIKEAVEVGKETEIKLRANDNNQAADNIKILTELAQDYLVLPGMKEVLRELVDTIKGSHISDEDWIKREIDQALAQIKEELLEEMNKLPQFTKDDDKDLDTYLIKTGRTR